MSLPGMACSTRELHSRYEVALEQYCLSIAVEAKTMLEMAETVIFPAASRYQTELASNAASLKTIGYDYDLSALDALSGSISELRAGIVALTTALAHDEPASPLEEAAYACDVIVPATLLARHAADALEHLVADDLWPLATYQEMLFIL